MKEGSYTCGYFVAYIFYIHFFLNMQRYLFVWQPVSPCKSNKHFLYSNAGIFPSLYYNVLLCRTYWSTWVRFYGFFYGVSIAGSQANSLAACCFFFSHLFWRIVRWIKSGILCAFVVYIFFIHGCTCLFNILPLVVGSCIILFEILSFIVSRSYTFAYLVSLVYFSTVSLVM